MQNTTPEVDISYFAFETKIRDLVLRLLKPLQD